MDNQRLAEIIQSAINGDNSAQAELYSAFSKSVYFTAYKLLQHKEDSEDIVNDVFLTVFKEIKKLENPASFSAWLKRITVNRCKKWLARNPSAFTADIDSIDNVDESEFEEELDPKLLPESSLDDTESIHMIVAIIDNLPIELRCVVYGYYYEQMTIQQLADMLALSDRAVKKRLAAARQKIREEIERVEDRDGIRLHAVGLPFLPIGAVLKSAYESFEVSPESLSAIFENITQNLSATAVTSTAATAAVTAATTKGVTLMAAKAIIAIIASVVIVGGVITGVALLSQDNSNDQPSGNNRTAVTTPRNNNNNENNQTNNNDTSIITTDTITTEPVYITFDTLITFNDFKINKETTAKNYIEAGFHIGGGVGFDDKLRYDSTRVEVITSGGADFYGNTVAPVFFYENEEKYLFGLSCFNLAWDSEVKARATIDDLLPYTFWVHNTPASKDVFFLGDKGFNMNMSPDEVLAKIKSIDGVSYEHRGEDRGVQTFNDGTSIDEIWLYFSDTIGDRLYADIHFYWFSQELDQLYYVKFTNNEKLRELSLY